MREPDSSQAEEGPQIVDKEELTPRQTVEELDKYIIGQNDAKRAVAIALRNRIRRRYIPEELRAEIIPKNILMIGPTGVGKTEIARRLASLVAAPFMKVEATKFTEVGYVGRDVDSMVRDLVDIAYRMVEDEAFDSVWDEAERRAQDRLLTILAGATTAPEPEAAPTPPPLGGPERSIVAAEIEEHRRHERLRQQNERVREFTKMRLEAGELEDEEVEVEIEEQNVGTMQMFSAAGMEEMGFNMQDMLSNIFPPKKVSRRMSVREARQVLTYEEAERLVDAQQVAREAVTRVEEDGIIFIDEIDKVAGRETGHGPDVSREGVQRDILPIVEGCTVMTKYGPVETNHILFIAAGAFHVSKPADMIPELQGRFPLRVELHSLTQNDFVRILKEPQNALVKQYRALLATETVQLDFTDDALQEIARFAQVVNEQAENIGARRLYTLMEKILDELSFEACDPGERSVTIDAQYVRDKLKDVVADTDLSRYML